MQYPPDDHAFITQDVRQLHKLRGVHTRRSRNDAGTDAIESATLTISQHRPPAPAASKGRWLAAALSLLAWAVSSSAMILGASTRCNALGVLCPLDSEPEHGQG